MSALWDLKTLFNNRCMQLEQRFLDAGLVFHLDQCARTDEQAVINWYGPTARHELAALVQEKFPALALALLNNGNERSPLMTVHRWALGRDYNLFRNGAYLADTDSHRPFGEFWETLHPSCRWGGRFGDGNHYSMEYMGVK